MKKFIIAAALVLSTAVTAFSLTTSNKAPENKLKDKSIINTAITTSAPKSDIATAD